MRQSRKFSGARGSCAAPRAFGDYDRLQRRRSTFRWGSLKRKTASPRKHPGAPVPSTSHRSRGSPRPFLQSLGRRKLALGIADRRMQKFRQSSALDVWCFDGPADKAIRILLRPIALRQRREASHSKTTSCEMRTRRGILFHPAVAGLSECALPARRVRVSWRRFWLFNVRT